MMPVRDAVVAGKFYPGTRLAVEDAVREMIGPGPKQKALGVMVPHAGYMYSGKVAGEVYGAVEMPQSFIVVGPNHTGLGPMASIMTSGVWSLPGGDASINQELAGAVLSHSNTLESDDQAHISEHSIEVQIPFMQYLVDQVTFVPISMMVHSLEACRDIGLSLIHISEP